MIRSTAISFTLFILLAVVPEAAICQHSRLVATNDWSYEYIRRLQRRGHLLDLHPTALPYTHGDVASALRTVDRLSLSAPERAWFDLLSRRFAAARTRRDEAVIGGWLEAGARAADNDRLDPVRYTDAGSPTLELGDIRVFPNASLNLYLDAQPVAAEIGLRHDIFYDVDPDGLDAVLRMNVRNEHAYAGYHSRLLDLYLGRFSNHWASIGQPALLLSDNPRTFDQLNVRLGGKRLALRSVLGELDAMTSDGRFTGRAADPPRGTPINRFISAHRFDWRPSRNVALTFMEALLYSGPGTSPSLKFATPVHVFLYMVDNRPKNEEHKGLVLGALWARHRNWTLDGQFLLDDVDIEHRVEPASVALAGQLTRGGVAPWLDLGFSGVLATGLAYNTHQPEGVYVHMLRGIGTQFSDFVQATLFADVYPTEIPSLSFRPQVHMLWQGEGDMREPFPLDLASRETILIGTVEQVTRLSTAVRYQPLPQFWVEFDYGVNWIENEGRVQGRRRTRGVGVLTFGGRIALDRPYRLSF